jgi:hypothetical protein
LVCETFLLARCVRPRITPAGPPETIRETGVDTVTEGRLAAGPRCPMQLQSGGEASRVDVTSEAEDGQRSSVR